MCVGFGFGGFRFSFFFFFSGGFFDLFETGSYVALAPLELSEIHLLLPPEVMVLKVHAIPSSGPES